ncbi:MAG: peptide chain release factor N(5)-glutamine methyltransferase [Gemmatimonadota bacterium]|nr:MAG: peptide chain release factor N(5)-glutamine methyltransferase [Gemmatimonadota bacterium]
MPEPLARRESPGVGRADHIEMTNLTVQAALEVGRRTLAARSGDEAGHEALFLLAGVLGLPPGLAALERGRRLDDREAAEYEARLARRARGEPLQYVEGRAAFRELFLKVDRSVLIPRPETELLVDEVLAWSHGKECLTALDLGTGSGAIAISLLAEGPFEHAVGVDISPEALKVARYNADEAGVQERLELRQGSLFSVLSPAERFDVVVSNPPYIASGAADALPAEVRDWEPPLALYAGETGLEVIHAIVVAAPSHLESGGLLALEVSPDVAAATLELMGAQGSYEGTRLLRDLAGRERIALAEREPRP